MNKNEYLKYYYDLGFSIVPIKAKSKEPAVWSWKGLQDKRMGLDNLVKIYEDNPQLNIGIVTGKVSNLVVVDFDTQDQELLKLFNIPPTLTVTTSKGYHYYFQYPKDFTMKSGNIPRILDLQADTKYIVAPPSVHSSGVEYIASHTIESMDELPVFSRDLLFQIMAIKYFYYYQHQQQEVPTKIVEGNRNIEATRLLGRCIKQVPKDKWESLVWPLFQTWNRMMCVPALDEKELKSIYRSISLRESLQPSTVNESKEDIEPVNFEITSSHDLLTSEIKEFPYIIDKLIPENAITSISADSGQGKSLLMMILIKYIASGRKMFDIFQVKKRKVLVIDQEMDADILMRRFRALINEELDIDYMIQQSWQIDNDKHLEWLRDKIIEKGYGVIVFDTFTHIHHGDENRADEMKKVNERMLRLIKDTNLTIVYLHHHRKPQRGEKVSQASSRGSTDLVAKVSSHLVVTSKKIVKDGKVSTSMTIQQTKSRRPHGINQVGLDVMYDLKEEKTSYEYKGEIDPQSAKEEAKEKIISILMEGGEYNIKSLNSAISGIGESNIRSACTELFLTKQIVRNKSGRSYVYSMPEL